MIILSIALVGMLLFYTILFILALNFIRIKFGANAAVIFIMLILLAGIVYSVITHNFLLTVPIIILGIFILKTVRAKLR